MARLFLEVFCLSIPANTVHTNLFAAGLCGVVLDLGSMNSSKLKSCGGPAEVSESAESSINWKSSDVKEWSIRTLL
ncbi:hypothetical protein BKA80DRAFT_301375 [Phyllosticta citrichinensis]